MKISPSLLIGIQKQTKLSLYEKEQGTLDNTHCLLAFYFCIFIIFTMEKQLKEDEPQYIGVVLPKIFDLDDYIESVGFKADGLYYSKGNKRILIENEYFCCLTSEDDETTGTEVHTILCQLAYLPDIWLMNVLLYQIGFIKKLY